jgi:hypothetical protein
MSSELNMDSADVQKWIFYSGFDVPHARAVGGIRRP